MDGYEYTGADHRDGRGFDNVRGGTDEELYLLSVKGVLESFLRLVSLFLAFIVPVCIVHENVLPAFLQDTVSSIVQAQSASVAADRVSRSSGKEPESFRSVQLIAVCPIVSSHLCSIRSRQASCRLP
jgi:hypothetical protein